jgi:sirohydrochlorin cobaltochelatase
MTSPLREETPLLVVGHGTRDAEGAAQFLALVERVRHRPGAPGVVEGGFIELAPPPVQDAVRAVVSTGHLHLAAVPLVLAPAGHGKGDIPGAMMREQGRHPGLTYVYGRPLGPHPVLQDMMARRIDDALGLPADLNAADLDDHGRAQARADVFVVLVGRGSSDPDANAEVAKVSRLLYEGRGYAGVDTSFISLAEPGVPVALERARRLGASRIVVAPYFLFPGVLPDRILTQTLDFAKEHPALDVRLADVIGDCDELADLTLERYREALTGDIRMNCDTCAYRVPLPGFTDKVGRPQRPHDHPDDPTHSHVHELDHVHDPHHHHDHSNELNDHSHELNDDACHQHSGAGWVALVGGGPGPDDLLTVRGRRLLDQADVVVVDRLAPRGLLTSLRDGVVVVDAAKQARGPGMPQEEINRLLVDYARAGRRVVRLKGGDPFVFGRGHEELETCVLAGVTVQVVPGVSSAFAVPAAAGVPVTHRGIAHEVVVVSGHLPPGHPQSLVNWEALGRLSGTLVVLMGVATMPAISRALVAAGRPARTPVLVVENGFAAAERVVPTTLGGVAEALAENEVATPAVIVVGDVVQRRDVVRDLLSLGKLTTVEPAGAAGS